ncbi:MAG: M20/M25/M40 family metallo-hydrolase, partial [Oscillospiraceae bacterium]
YLAFKLVKKAVDSGIKLHGTLIFSLVVMEEPAESMGMEYLLETTFPEHGLHCDVVYLCEPTSGDVALGQRGKVELAVSVRGKCAHSSRPEEGINAVQKALPVLDAIFSGFNEAPVTHPRLGSSSMTVTDLKVSPGGLSVVPDLCEISLDRRYVPPQTIDDTVFQVQALLDKLAAADPEFSASVAPRSTHRRCYTGYEKDMPKRHPAWETARDNNFVLATLEALRAVGLPCDEKYWQFGTDGSVSAGGYGIPTIGYSHARESWAHQPKERVCIDDMLCSVEGYSAILCKLFALPLDDVISSNK